MQGAKETEYDVIIAGGGLSGLTAAIMLSGKRKKVLLVEKKSYPFHKVCGEYVSNEVLGFLQSLGFNPFDYDASHITKLRISTPSGKNIFTSLDLGGFGLSRFRMDHALFQLAEKKGVDVLTATKISDIQFHGNYFQVKTSTGESFSSKLVIGSYGKRDVLDKKLNRDFIHSHTGYMGVKYHLKTDYPGDEIGLDNFENGYCGIVKIEEDKYNLCYLYRRTAKTSFSSIRDLEENILFKNPVIRNIFSRSEFLFAEPEVINEISFASKKVIEDHIVMCGDSAGLITPLCGNGMSMAVHAAKLLCEIILVSGILDKSEIPLHEREHLEETYRKLWTKNFRNRLFLGRTLQGIFGNTTLTGLSLQFLHSIPFIEQWVISKTHGKPL